MSIFNKPEGDFDKIRQAYSDSITDKFFDILDDDKWHSDNPCVYGCNINVGNVVVFSDTRSKRVELGVVKEVFPYGKTFKVRIQLGSHEKAWCREETMMMSSVLKISDSILDYIEYMGIDIKI